MEKVFFFFFFFGRNFNSIKYKSLSQCLFPSPPPKKNAIARRPVRRLRDGGGGWVVKARGLQTDDPGSNPTDCHKQSIREHTLTDKNDTFCFSAFEAVNKENEHWHLFEWCNPCELFYPLLFLSEVATLLWNLSVSLTPSLWCMESSIYRYSFHLFYRMCEESILVF